MTRVIFLDTGIMGLVTHPHGSDQSRSCTSKLLQLLEGGAEVCIPEVSDYELRRDYLRRGAHAARALERLDRLKETFRYVPIDTPTMIDAASLWAEVRQRGLPTAHPKELDCDVILAAQARRTAKDGDDLVIATDNVGHLARFAAAMSWDKL